MSENRSSIQVIERMMALLDAIAESADAVNLKRLAGRTKLHPSTAHRILGVMVDSRLIDRVEPGAYRLGIRLLELGNLVKSRLNIRQEALPYMDRLHQQLQETVNLSVRQGDEMIYVERSSSNRSMMQVVQIVGTRAPLHITAVGKIYLAEEGARGWADYAKRTGLPAFTDNTLSTLTSLAHELDRVKRQGYAFDNEEAEKGVSCIGAGIHDEEGKLVGGLSLSAPSERLDKAWATEVKKTADQISYAVGFRPARRAADARNQTSQSVDAAANPAR